MHPDADFGDPVRCRISVSFFASSGTVEPGINPMQSDFASRSRQLLDRVRDILGPIASCAKLGAEPSDGLSRIVLERNNEKSRVEPFLQFQVTIIELAPEVFRETKVNKGQLQSCYPVREQIAERTSVLESASATNRRWPGTKSRTSCDPTCVGGSRDGQHRVSGKL